MLLPQTVDALYPGPPVFTPDDLLWQPRANSFRFDLLDTSDGLIGSLDGVQPGGSVQQDSTAAVHGSGSITVTDIGQGVDWTGVRVRPVLTMTDPSGNGTEYPLGVFIPAAPQETWTDFGRSWAVQLTDKLGVLDTNIPTDSSGNPVTYGVPAGANVIGTVCQLIEGAGGTTEAIQPDSESLVKAMAWTLGTSTLQIINDLLAASGYFSLSCNGAGQYQCTSYVVPSQRPPLFTGRNPFSDTPGDSLMSPDYTRNCDVYGIPQFLLAIAQGDGTNPALTSVGTNPNPAPSQVGRWVVNSSLQATSQAALDSQALMLMSQAMSVTSTFTVSHLWLPTLGMNQAVQFVDSRGDFDMLCYVTSTTTALDPTGMCQSNLSEAVI